MQYTKEQIERWGRRASFDFLHNNKPLIDSVKQIASENNLNQEQIKRVAQIANTKTMVSIYENPSVDDTAEFDVVDPAKVIDILSSKGVDKRVKTASLINNITSDYNISFSAHMLKGLPMEKNASLSKTAMEIKLAKLKQIEKVFRNEAEKARLESKRALYKHASSLEELAKVISKAKAKGISVDDMLNAALRMGDDAQTVREVFRRSLNIAKDKMSTLGGSISSAIGSVWDKAKSGIKSFFKLSSDGSVVVDKEYLQSRIENAKKKEHITRLVLKPKDPINMTIEHAFNTRSDARIADGITRNMNQVAEAAAEKIKKLEKSMKEVKPDDK